MKRNIFENAYFGKAYKTRGGEKVILVTLLDDVAYLLSEEKIGKTSLFGNHIHSYRLDGICIDKQGYILDIDSEWQEEINNEELDESNGDSCDDRNIFIEGFKAGQLACCNGL